jgi:hypothetical protein
MWNASIPWFAFSSADCSGKTMLDMKLLSSFYNSAGWSVWWPFCQAYVGQTVLLHPSAVHSVIAKVLKDNSPNTAIYVEQQLKLLHWYISVQLQHSVYINDKRVWRWHTATSVLVHDTHLKSQHHFCTCWIDIASVPYSHNVCGCSQIPCIVSIRIW